MPYNFHEISDYDLTLFFIVINDLEHKANLMNASGPLPFNNTPKGITKDEQIAILNRLERDSYISPTMDGKSYFINEHYKNVSWGDLFDSVHKEYHKRFNKPEQPKNILPHYDPINGMLHIQGFKIRINYRTNKKSLFDCALCRKRLSLW